MEHFTRTPKKEKKETKEKKEKAGLMPNENIPQ